MYNQSRAILVVALVAMTGCYSRTVNVSLPPRPDQISAFNQHDGEQASAYLSNSGVLTAHDWELGTSDLRFRNNDGLARPLALSDVQRVDFRLSRGEAARLGLWRGALVGAPVGALLGLLAHQPGSCTPEPCTAPEWGYGDSASFGAIAGVALGAVMGGTIGLIAGGRLSFSFAHGK